MRVKFLFAMDSLRWKTEIHEVPEDRCNTLLDMVTWANDKFLVQPEYCDVELIAVYDDDLEED